ncbi:hypothetical protein SAMN05216298_0548 [Glycomyces sambucus]|uniref:N-acetyltransferase domain-containing protein n=2 Tax=Glycomyces sambucus TaxID=380244 RepID=A0A1G9CWP4_9ACTN|nr:hypothetical protein [Glycomyces sambucus]SDK56077.1 hypothetical protein SAMN05216298_0548 [Glycomyces sambucus]
MDTTRTSAAAHDNAAWCDAMCRAHGTPGGFAADAWTSPVRTPVYYPDAVTLAPGADAASVLARIDSGAGASVKDSFADLDLRPFGFEVLFEARWIHRPAGPADAAWREVADPEALREWARAWDGGEGNAEVFRPALLDLPGVHLIAGEPAGSAGAVLTRTGPVVGVSNVFAARGDGWPAALAAAHDLYPGVPVVGYEHGDGLAAAERHGFAPVGPLRVWLRA